MNERQYRQVLMNRSRRGFSSLAERGYLARWLRSAARDLRERQRAAEAWERCLPGNWSGQARVLAARSGVLTVEAADPISAARLRRGESEILKRMRSSYPAARELRVVLAGEVDDLDELT